MQPREADAYQYLKSSFGNNTFTIADVRKAFNASKADHIVKRTDWIEKVSHNTYRLIETQRTPA
jgi:hypothetical protein